METERPQLGGAEACPFGDVTPGDGAVPGSWVRFIASQIVPKQISWAMLKTLRGEPHPP